MSSLTSGRLIVDEPAPGVARLTISNPGKRGALDHALMDAIAATVPQLEARCLIVTGEAPAFSAGYDIGNFAEETFAEEAEEIIAHPFPPAWAALEDFPHPTLAVLNGHTIGGGLELALACDLRVAAANISLGMPPAKLGLVYSHTGIRRFIDAIGGARTRELLLLGRYIDATTAERWGLVNAVVEPERIEEEGLSWATELAGGAPLSIKGNKRAVRAVLEAGKTLAPELEEELIELRRACFFSEDFREGVRAFVEKRPARWQGR